MASCQLPPLLTNIVLVLLANVTRPEKMNRKIKMGKKMLYLYVYDNISNSQDKPKFNNKKFSMLANCKIHM